MGFLLTRGLVYLFVYLPDFSYAILGLCLQNQFFISGLSGDEVIRNRVLEALYRRILRAHNDKKLFRAIIVIPLLPGFQVLYFWSVCLEKLIIFLSKLIK